MLKFQSGNKNQRSVSLEKAFFRYNSFVRNWNIKNNEKERDGEKCMRGRDTREWDRAREGRSERKKEHVWKR